MNSITGMSSAYSAYSTAMTNKASKNVKTAETEKTTELTEAEKLEAFKKEIWNEINSIRQHPGQSVSIQITDDAFKRMMEELEFKDEMMFMLHEDARVALKHYAWFTNCSAITTITKDGYSGMSWHNDYCKSPPSFDDHAKDAFYVKKADKKSSNSKSSQEAAKKQKTLDQIMLERALETKANNEKHLKGLLEKGRLSQNDIALSRYEQNQMYL